MVKTFKLYVEEKEQERKLKDMFLQRLGFEPKAMDNLAIKLRDLSKDRVQEAISSIGLDADTVGRLTNWVSNNPDTTLQNLLAQISTDAIDDFGQNDIPEEPAELPIGNPKPERRPVPPMYGGPPPMDGKLT